MTEEIKQEMQDMFNAIIRQRDEALGKIVQLETIISKLKRELHKCHTALTVSNQDTEQVNVQDEEKE